MQIDSNFIFGLAIFLSGIFTQIIVSRLGWRQTEAENREKRLQEERNYYLSLIRSLVGLRSKLQYLQGVSPDFSDPAFKEQQDAYGEAYAIMLSVNDKTVRSRAEVVMKGAGDPGKNEKIDAINEAILRLGEIVDGLYSK